MSAFSASSTGSQKEDWDGSLVLSESELAPYSESQSFDHVISATTPRNSITFPADDDAAQDRTRADVGRKKGSSHAQGKRSLSELVGLRAETGTKCKFNQEEASQVADVLGQWINASSSPYEGEDDFFSRSQDDLAIPSRRSPAPVIEARPRGNSESTSLRPRGSVDF